MSRYLTDEELDAIKARTPRYGGGDYKALVAEVERLRAEVDLLRQEASIRRAINDGLSAAVDAERAAVVAWLHWGSDPLLDDAADAIERGEHRREEGR